MVNSGTGCIYSISHTSPSELLRNNEGEAEVGVVQLGAGQQAKMGSCCCPMLLLWGTREDGATLFLEKQNVRTKGKKGELQHWKFWFEVRKNIFLCSSGYELELGHINIAEKSSSLEWCKAWEGSEPWSHVLIFCFNLIFAWKRINQLNSMGSFCLLYEIRRNVAIVCL